MKYGDKPKILGNYSIDIIEMFFYQYLPIKLPEETQPIYEQRLNIFDKIIGAICCDFIGEFGLDNYVSSYIYLTAKNLYQTQNCSFNRPGYHSDGFMTNDINYIWCNKNPTVFNSSDFNITQDDTISLLEMEQQGLKENEFTYPEDCLLRLNQYNIHKVAESQNEGVRAFLKVSFSKDKYDLKGNSHNYLLNYNWQMKDRKPERNIPQTIKFYKNEN